MMTSYKTLVQHTSCIFVPKPQGFLIIPLTSSIILRSIFIYHEWLESLIPLAIQISSLMFFLNDRYAPSIFQTSAISNAYFSYRR